MVIQMCQAANLAELMTKMQKDFGPDAVLLAVRRVDMASNGAGFVVEGTIGVKRASDPLFATRKPVLQTPPIIAQPAPERVPAAKPYEAPARPVGMVQPVQAKHAQPPVVQAAQQKVAAPAPVLAKEEKNVRPALFAKMHSDPIPSAYPNARGNTAAVVTPAVEPEQAPVQSPIQSLGKAAAAILSPLSPRQQQEVAKSNFLRQHLTSERARARTGGKFGTHSIALVGPMGAGKTTTTAKIAGRFRNLRKEPVGVVSTDTDRPGGSTLLMAYAQELQLHGTTATTASELRDRMVRWSRRGPLVIDTRGCSPRDSLAIERMGEMFKTSGFEVERYLVLSATEHPLVARECLENFDELELNGVILTRVDQAAGIGHCLEEVRKSGLPILFAGTGESVPQDLIEPTATTFRALEIKAQAVLA